MKRVRKLYNIIEKAIEIIYSKEFKSESCMKKKDFTRERKLNFVDYIVCIMRGSKKSLQLATDIFINEYKQQVTEYSKQAFSKGRLRIKPEAFFQLFLESVRGFYEDGAYRRIKGYRVLAIDGTDYNLPNTTELLDKFGSEEYGKNKKIQVQAQGSSLYDVLNGMLLDVSINRYDTSERDLAINHMEALKINNLKTDKELVIMDRGYPSRKMLAYCEDNGYKYLIRCNKENFLAAVRDVKGDDEIISTQYEGNTYNIRVVTFHTGNTTETLLTNLLEEFTVNELGDIYNKRWGIETIYNDIKNKMEIENFSGKSEITVLQDFYATMTLSNYVSAMEYDSQEKLDEINKNKELKYKYKVNRAMAIGKLKYNFIGIFLEKSPKKQSRILNNIIKELTKYTVAIVPGRSFLREKKHLSQKYPMNIKSVN